jgi:hypothetical protein
LFGVTVKVVDGAGRRQYEVCNRAGLSENVTDPRGLSARARMAWARQQASPSTASLSVSR